MRYLDLKIKNDQGYDYTHFKVNFKCYKLVNFSLKQKRWPVVGTVYTMVLVQYILIPS